MKLEREIRLRLNRWRGYARQQGIRVPVDRTILSDVVERALTGNRYEHWEARLARRLLHPSDTVLELGSGLGFMSALLRRHTPVGRIVTYEANPDLIDYIARLHKLNGISDVEVRHGVVLADPQARSIPFHIRANMWSSSLSPDGSEQEGLVLRSVEVPVFAWADVIEEMQPNAVVMDIEGGELGIIDACDFGPIRRMVVELHPRAYGIAGMARIYGALDRHRFVDQLGISHDNVLAIERP